MIEPSKEEISERVLEVLALAERLGFKKGLERAAEIAGNRPWAVGKEIAENILAETKK